MDRSVTSSPGESGHHNRTLVIVFAVAAITLLALAWLIAAPAAGIG